MTFVCTTVSGVFFILAPEEPSLNFGGGAYYSLAIGIVLFLLALCTLFFGIFGCTSVARDSKHRLLLVSNLCSDEIIAVRVHFSYSIHCLDLY